MMMALRLFILLLAAFFSLGAVDQFHIPSECAVDMYLPPMPGTPDTDGQEIALVPATTADFRLCYATSPGVLCGAATYATGGDSGQTVTGNTRGEFAITGLSANTKYHWRVECSQHGRWRHGWSGQFKTLPTANDDIVLAVGTDGHYLVNFWTSDGEDPGAAANAYDLVRRSRGVYHVLNREKDLHFFLDLGDTFFHHCGTCGTTRTFTDEFGRRVGIGSSTEMARTLAEDIAFGEVRTSMALRRMWRFLRNSATIWVRGNHDVGGKFGHNAPDHWQWRTQPWVTPGFSLTLGAGGDFSSGGNIHSATHGLSHGDGPFRLVGSNWDVGIIAPFSAVCGAGPVDATLSGSEFYIKTNGVTANTDNFEFSLSDDAASTTCTFASLGSPIGATAVLVKGSDMQHSTKQVAAKYLPNQNEVYAHGYSGVSEDGIMGPMPLADYGMLLSIDPFDYSPSYDCSSLGGSACFPGRDTWTLGTDQLTGVGTLIDQLGVGGGSYPDVKLLLLALHHGVGGYDLVGSHAYGRGTLCEVATRCMNADDTYCTVDSQCPGSDRCRRQDCADDFDNAEWQAMQETLEDFVTRADGVVIVMVGHDHVLAFGEKYRYIGGVKTATGVYYLTAGQLGSKLTAGWFGDPESVKRYDFNHDGVPAYLRHYKTQGWESLFTGWDTFPPPPPQDALVEVGSEHRGYVKMTLCKGCAAGKPKVVLDYIIGNQPEFGFLDGQSAPGFPLTIEGP